MMTTAAVALILNISVPAMSQTTELVEVGGIQFQMGARADSEEIVQWKVLAARNGIDTKKKLRETSRDNLAIANRLTYKFQRVEVSGVAAIDDAEETLPGMIDKQVKTSNLNEVLPSQSPLLNKLRSYYAKVVDLKEAMSDTQGNPTERCKKKIDELKDARINELFAHSWGTEVVYLGILNGTILPPRKLIIMGVPEANEEKWRMLAKYTGIEVHVVGFEWDKARIAGDATTHLKSGLPQDTAGLEKLWRDRCADKWRGPACADPNEFIRTKFDYDVHIRPPGVPKGDFINGHLSKLDHEKALYYTHLSNRGLFNRTIAQLDAPQLKLIIGEEKRILAESMTEARGLVAQAREQIEIAHRDHDERLRNTKADMARRSCESPGSVTQAEFDLLPDPYIQDIVGWAPADISECAQWVYRSLGRGVDAAEIRRKSTPTPGPADPHPSRPAHLAPSSPKTSFFTVLPGLKEYAVTACATPDQVPLDTRFTRPNWDFSFSKETDDQAVEELSAGLGVCERRLFHRLIGVIRNGNPQNITPNWLQDRVREYTLPSGANNGKTSVSPPSQLPPGDDPCRDRGNERCP